MSITNQLNQRVEKTPKDKSSRVRVYYDQSILTEPILDLLIIKDIPVWLIYKVSNTEMQFLELQKESIELAKKLVIEFEPEFMPNIQTENSVIDGQTLSRALQSFDERRLIHVINSKENFVKVRITK